MSWLRESALFRRLLGSHLGAVALTILLLAIGLITVVRRERLEHYERDARYMAQVADRLDWNTAAAPTNDRAYIVRTAIGWAVVMKPEMLVSVRSGTPVEMQIRQETSGLTDGLSLPSPSIDEVKKEVTAALRSLSLKEVDRFSTLATPVVLCPPDTRGTVAHCAVLAPINLHPPVRLVVVALFPPGVLDDLVVGFFSLTWPIAAALILVPLLVAWAWKQPLLVPIRQLRRGLQGLQVCDLRRRVSVEAPGEIGQLVHDFNLALDNLDLAKLHHEEVDRGRRDLVASVSHEFRAPLASLRGYLELYRDGVIPPQEQTRYVQVMLSDTLRLNRLVEDLLEFVRLQSHHVTFYLTPTDPREACQRVVEQVAWRTTSNHVRLSVDLPDHLPAVKADPDRLDQALVNLLENALRYAGDGGWVVLSARLGEDTVRFAVSDSGPGIPRHARQEVWRRFYKVEKARTPGDGGSGLGLPIVKELVTTMGGQVGLENEAGKGNTVWFTIPLIECER